ncbi:hypothetical protein [Sodalis sp. RH16]|uniref:hypothetical protein n=1 Tax=Sodalis sp. RH16 TaxID=3394331 RepID=UPI0039B513A3
MNFSVEPIGIQPGSSHHSIKNTRSLHHHLTYASSTHNTLPQYKEPLNGHDLYTLAAEYNKEKSQRIKYHLNNKPNLKPPNNNVRKLIYGLLGLSNIGDHQHRATIRDTHSVFSLLPIPPKKIIPFVKKRPPTFLRSLTIPMIGQPFP